MNKMVLELCNTSDFSALIGFFSMMKIVSQNPLKSSEGITILPPGIYGFTSSSLPFTDTECFSFQRPQVFKKAGKSRFQNIPHINK
jgi:hypothetical protein